MAQPLTVGVGSFAETVAGELGRACAVGLCHLEEEGRPVLQVVGYHDHEGDGSLHRRGKLDECSEVARAFLTVLPNPRGAEVVVLEGGDEGAVHKEDERQVALG